MLEALAWGALASGMLLVGALLAWGLKPSQRLNAIIMAVYIR